MKRTYSVLFGLVISIILIMPLTCYAESAIDAGARGAVIGLVLAIGFAVFYAVVWIFKKTVNAAKTAAPINARQDILITGGSMKPLVNSIAGTLILLTTALLTGCDIVSGISADAGKAVDTAANQAYKAGGAISGRNTAVEVCTKAVEQKYPGVEKNPGYVVEGLGKFNVVFQLCCAAPNYAPKPRDENRLVRGLREFEDSLPMVKEMIYINCYTDNGSIIKIE